MNIKFIFISSLLAWSCPSQSCTLCIVGFLCSKHLLTSRLPLGKCLSFLSFLNTYTCVTMLPCLIFAYFNLCQPLFYFSQTSCVSAEMHLHPFLKHIKHFIVHVCCFSSCDILLGWLRICNFSRNSKVGVSFFFLREFMFTVFALNCC